MRRTTWQWLVALFLIVGVGLVLWTHRQTSHAQGLQNAIASAVGEAKDCPAGAGGKAGQPYRFVAFGDWGAGTPFQRDVAKQLIERYRKQPFDAALLLGDNIYEDGNVRKHGKAYFTDMYTPLIEGGVKFVVALGNHDIKGGYQADQLKFFNMPGYYYTVVRGPMEFFVLNTNTFHNDELQQKWLDKALTASKSDWKVVMGHHPIYSSGEHGNRPALKNALEPLLHKHRVALYLAGHDHDYERFDPAMGVQHIVSGGAGAYLRDFEKLAPGSIKRMKVHHFLSFELKGDTLSMQAIDKTGQVIDQAQWQKQPATQKQPAAKAR